MNGELSQICEIVICTRRALRDDLPLDFAPAQYVNHIGFSFIDKSRGSAGSVSQWLEALRNIGIADIKCIFPTTTDNRNHLGFSDMTKSSIACFPKSGTATYFAPEWGFDHHNKLWEVLYREHEFETPPNVIPTFCDNTEDFKQVLAEIAALAKKIGAQRFFDVFRSAFDYLDSKTCSDRHSFTAGLPERNRALYSAAHCADVFGAMGSWNDEPPHMAYEKGLGHEYNRLSDLLFTQIRLALLYAVNEF